MLCSWTYIYCLIIVISESKKSLRVWYGRDMEVGEYPFVVLIVPAVGEMDTWMAECTASMLTKTWVLTASHCFWGNPYEEEVPYYVWHGNYSAPPSDMKTLSKILEIFQHPGKHVVEIFDDDLFYAENDIAMVHCEETILPSYGRLSAIDRSCLTGLPVVYVGGGGTDKYKIYKPLQVGEGMVAKCGPEIRKFSKFIICVTPKCSKPKSEPYQGDSGGPFLHEGLIVGVLSLTYRTIKSKVSWHGINPVSPYTDWIAGLIQSKDNGS